MLPFLSIDIKRFKLIHFSHRWEESYYIINPLILPYEGKANERCAGK
ncbi:hypothetical protein [Pectobacterium sp. B1J-3]